MCHWDGFRGEIILPHRNGQSFLLSFVLCLVSFSHPCMYLAGFHGMICFIHGYVIIQFHDGRRKVCIYIHVVH